MPYQIILSEEAETHLQLLTARDRRIVIGGIEDQLLYQANVPTRNRQPIRPNNIATWKLRLGSLRVYYDLEETEQIVQILAIGVKERNRVRIGDRDLEL